MLFERRARRSPLPAGLILMHHEIAPEQGDEGRDLLPALGADLFRAQLQHLGRQYEFVPLRDLVARAGSRSAGDRIPVAVTFDDDVANHAAVAAPILTELGIPATFFLSGNCLRGPSPHWWQDLQLIVDQGPEGLARMQQELGEVWSWAKLDGGVGNLSMTIEALRPDQRDQVCARLRELAGPKPLDEGLSAEAVEGMARSGFEIGFHTLRHYSLPTLDDKELDRAMTDGLDELAAVAGRRPTSIAYPHAKADLRVAEAAQRAGFELGFGVGDAATSPDQHPLLLSRFVAWTVSLGNFQWGLGRVLSRA